MLGEREKLSLFDIKGRVRKLFKLRILYRYKVENWYY